MGPSCSQTTGLSHALNCQAISSDFHHKEDKKVLLKVGSSCCQATAISHFQNCSSQPSIVHWLSSPIFPCSFGRLSVRPAMVTSDQISTFFNMYRYKSLVLTQFYLIPSSIKLYWPSTTKYQSVPHHTDPAPPTTNQCCLVLTIYHRISTSTAP